jgi:hypothetical protein
MSTAAAAEPLAQQFYKRQLLESNTVVFSAVLFGLILIFIVVSVFFTLRSQYTLMFESLGSGSFAFMVALAHTYPFLSSIFFKNRNTPDIIVNACYSLFDPTQNSVQWSSVAIAACGTKGNACLFKKYIVDVDNWRSAIGTICWYSESNANYGYDQVMQWATGQCNETCGAGTGGCNNYCTAGGGMFASPPQPAGPGTSATTIFFSYIMPLLSLAAMLFL